MCAACTYRQIQQLQATTEPGLYLLYEIRILKASSSFLVVRNRQRSSHKRRKKWNILHARCGVSMAWKFITPAVLKNHFANVASTQQVHRIPTDANGWNCRATMIALVLLKNFWMLTNVPKTTNRLTHTNEPGPSLKHMVGEEEEKMAKTRPLTQML